MQTQFEAAKAGVTTPAMVAVAAYEGVDSSKVLEEVAAGRAVIPMNPAHASVKPTIAGRAFRTKINANLGYSPQRSTVPEELGKLELAISLGSDFVMDLSVGMGVEHVRRQFIEASTAPLGSR